MWPLIVEFADIIQQPNMSAHSIIAYFLYGTGMELWAAIKDKRCIGFVCFQIMGPPYYATGTRNFIYMQEKDAELSEKLSAKFSNFLKRNNLKYYMFHSQTEKMGEHFKTKLRLSGLDTLQTEYIHTGKMIMGGK